MFGIIVLKNHLGIISGSLYFHKLLSVMMTRLLWNVVMTNNNLHNPQYLC
jgi:hypothetical protein